ncbi:MAG: right-handed parallel beta-helix repeat-containing protein, partial [Candidatus Thermoplasmatota archaeon]|nr:right-handed parallel beta-helix repeat-containing protein [Candidatus Thermoplasmatota archaeon]
MNAENVIGKSELAHKKIFHHALAICLVVVAVMFIAMMMAESAEAADGTFGGGDGSEGTPYLIEDVLDLQAMNDHLGDNFTLANDIDASATVGWNGGEGFVPVGSNATPFTGGFDGCNHVITGLYIDRSTTKYVGLFGYADAAAVVKNVGLVDNDITGFDYVGGLLGYSAATVNNSFATGPVTGSGAVGGLIGDMLEGTVTNSYATGNVTADDYCGGFIGFTEYGAVSNCYSTGSVITDGTGYYQGGFIGKNYATDVSYCYSTGRVVYTTYTDPTDKGFCILGSGSWVLTNNYWDTETSLQDSSEGDFVPERVSGKTTAEMKTQSTFVGWDFTDVWWMEEGQTYPILRSTFQIINVDTGLYYETIQAAIDAANPGEKIYVASGTYVEQITITKNITLAGDGAGSSIIQAPLAGRATIVENGITWDYAVAADGSGTPIEVKIEGFTIDANGLGADANQNFAGVFFRDVGVSSAQGLYSCAIYNFGAYGPVWSGTYNTWMGNYGVVVYGDSTLSIQGNEFDDYTTSAVSARGVNVDITVTGNDLDGTDSGYAGIFLREGVGLISGNNIHDHAGAAESMGIYCYAAAAGTAIDDSTSANTFNNNYIDILFAYTDGATISGNTFTNTEFRSIALGLDSDGNVISGNTITMSGADTSAAIVIGSDCGGNVIGGNLPADGNAITMSTSTSLGGDHMPHGIYFAGIGASDNTVQSNTIDGSASAIQIDGNTGTTTVSDNIIGGTTPPSFRGIQINGGNLLATYNTLYNCVRPFEFWGAANVEISYNVINGSTFDGINLGSASGAITISNNEIFNLPANVYGIYVRPDSDGAIIDGNEIYDSDRGIAIQGGATGVSIINNYIHDNGFAGIHLWDVPAAVTGNTLYNNWRGIETYVALTAHNNKLLFHNYGSIILGHPGPHDVELNWWGDATGPSGGGPGTGSILNTNGNTVDYTP